MQDEHPDHPHHLLHWRMRVVEVRAILMNCELVHEPRPRTNRFLREVRHSVHRIRDFKAVPVNGKRFGQTILKDDAHVIALIDLNRQAPDAVKPQQSIVFQGAIFRFTGSAIS